MANKKKLWIIIVSCVLAVALITTAVLLIVANSNREKTQTSIMSMSVNPQVHFVLNGNDKVMEVIALNAEGEEIAEVGEFVGLQAYEAAQLFVKLSTEAGYIKYDTDGTKVDINLSGLKNDYVSLKDKVVKSVNNYFDEKGIIAGAVAKIEEDFKNTIKELKPTAKNLDEKSEKDLMEQYKKILGLIRSDKYQIKASILTDFYAAYDKIDATYTEAVETINGILEDLKTKLATESDANEIAKLQSRIEIQEEQLRIALDTFNNSLNTYLNNFKVTENYLDSIVETFNTRVESQRDAFAAHIATFENNRETIEQKIADYRASLEA